MLALNKPPSKLFPSLETATPDGLVMVGGQLNTEWVIEAYTSGIFPWPYVDDAEETLAWYSPNPRAIIELESFHISRRLDRRMRSGQFDVTIDEDFAGVIQACSQPRKQDAGTWITKAVTELYCQLHECGHAHSVEVWQDDELVGGIYGVAFGGFFAGESMFHRRRDASKVALAVLVDHLKQRDFRLFDVQQSSPHLASLGATEIPRHVFLRRLQKSLRSGATFTDRPVENW